MILGGPKRQQFTCRALNDIEALRLHGLLSARLRNRRHPRGQGAAKNHRPSQALAPEKDKKIYLRKDKYRRNKSAYLVLASVTSVDSGEISLLIMALGLARPPTQPASVEAAVQMWCRRLACFSLPMLRLQLQELQDDVDVCGPHTVQ